MQSIHKFLLLFFLIIPFIEIFLLLEVGSIIGAVPTILWVVLTAVLGANLLRQQGFATWQRLQASLAQGVMPTTELVEGVFIMLGGVLLLTPGFFTDAMGFACMMPPVRQKIAQYVLTHFLTAQMQQGFQDPGTRRESTDVLEGEYRKED